MKRDTRLFIDDILESIKLIRQYLKNIQENEFYSSPQTEDAVTRRIEIIGEAAGKVPDLLRNKYPKIPWVKMTGMRNILAHEYFGVNNKTVWETAVKFIPSIENEIKKILEELNTEINRE